MASRSSQNRHVPSLSTRTTWVLRLIAIALVLIWVRIWHLSVVQHEERLERSRRPQRKIIVENADRGTIRDRFNQPLAINRLQYQAAIRYRDLMQVPRITWKREPDKEPIRQYKRKEYIERLSTLLGSILGLDPFDVEDLIYSRAALFHQIPYVIKRNITEEQYYKLKGLERDWVGIVAQRTARREYPYGRVASDVIGYMGSIGRKEYDSILSEMRTLEDYLLARDSGEEVSLPSPFTSIHEVRSRLHDLEEKAYRIDDFVGKTGIEGQFEEELRGYYGQKVFSSDARGNALRELPGGRQPVPGQRLLLSISAELQQYCESLLIENESLRDGQSQSWDRKVGHKTPLLQPWIKGGAIVVMDPNSGELLALASHPRYDPNDFIPSRGADDNNRRQSQLRRWLELESHIADVWDGRTPFYRERAGGEEEQLLRWKNYLDLILLPNHPVRERLEETPNIRAALDFLRSQETPPEESHEKLYTDLLHLLVDENSFPEELLEVIGDQTLSDYRAANLTYSVVERETREIVKKLFHTHHFRSWRQKYEKAYLRQKRHEEREAGRYQRPYLDYLDKVEARLFNEYWQNHRLPLLLSFITGSDTSDGAAHLRPYLKHLLNLSQEVHAGAHHALPWLPHYKELQAHLSGLQVPDATLYLRSMRSYRELTSPLVGRYSGLRNSKGVQQLKHLAAAFYPRYGFGYGRSFAFRQAATQGSIFKLVTGYQALLQRYNELGEQISLATLNPLTIVDRAERIGSSWRLGYFRNGEPIPSMYKGGRLLKSLSRNIGEIDIVGALERSSNPYFSLLAADYLEDPEDLNKAASSLGFGRRSGVLLPGELRGSLPKDLSTNPSGLYSYAIGQHTLVATPLQSACMLATLANGGNLLTPKILSLSAGREPVREITELLSSRTYAYQDALALAGVDFPLYTEALDRVDERRVEAHPSLVREKIDLPSEVRHLLLTGMERDVRRSRTITSGSLAAVYGGNSKILHDYINSPERFIGKSSTAQSRENVGITSHYGAETYDHIWFGSILFRPPLKQPTSEQFVINDRFGRPELVIVVYLRYGGSGHHAAPLITQISQKWREIQHRS